MIFDNLNEEQKQKVIQLETLNSKHEVVETRIFRDIEKENEHYVVIEEILNICKNKFTDKIMYFHYYIILCKFCGHIKKIYTSSFTNIYHECLGCKSINHINSFIGYENDLYKVLGYDHKIETKSGSCKLYYKVICKKCNTEQILRKDAILDISRKCCIHCKGNGVIPTIKAPLNVYRYYYIHGALSRDLEWALTPDEFEYLISRDCFYCGEKPRSIQHLKRYTKVKQQLFVNGIDRIDSSKGYFLENCVPCCTMCNRMKSNYSYRDFINHVHKIYEYHKGSTTIEKASNDET